MENSGELLYYYSVDGTVYGPLSLVKLLEKIDADTLVYREGIEWTNATEIDELKKFFNKPILEKGNKKKVSTVSDFENLNEVSSNEDLNHNTVYTEPQKMFASSFSFDGRIRRTEYALSFLIYLALVYVLGELFKSSSIKGFTFIPVLWFLWAQGAKRCHDRGNSGWWQIIPFYVFWMLFAEGDKEENEYGSSPKN
jgi:uncharacterized membrane protein YhaH (DUF805 family)